MYCSNTRSQSDLGRRKTISISTENYKRLQQYGQKYLRWGSAYNDIITELLVKQRFIESSNNKSSNDNEVLAQ